MKLTGAEIENIFEVLQELQNIKFNITTGYKIANLIKEIQPKYIEILDKKDELIKEYGDKDETGKVILDKENKAHISVEFSEEVQKKLSQIYDNIYTIDCKYIKVDELEETKLSLKQISNLMPILDK